VAHALAGQVPGLRSDVAVVVITRNRRDDLLRTVVGLVGLPENPRVVVVDNASEDGSVAALRALGADVDVIAASTNLEASARTVGAQISDCRYVAFCDDDVCWQPGALTRAVQVLDAHPSVALVCGRVVVGDDAHDDATCEFLARSPIPPRAGLPGPRLVGFLASASVVRRDAFIATGGFEPRLGVGGEESVVAYRLAAAGWDLVYAPDVVVHHRPSPVRDVTARRRVLARNEVLTAALARPLRALARTASRTARIAVHDRATARGLADAALALPWALRNRRVVPQPVAREIDVAERAWLAHERRRGSVTQGSVPQRSAPHARDRLQAHRPGVARAPMPPSVSRP